MSRAVDSSFNVGDNARSGDEDAKNSWNSSGCAEHSEIMLGLSYEEGAQDLPKDLSPQKHQKRQLQSSCTEPQPRKKRSRSQPPSLGWDSDNGVSTTNISDDSGSELPSNRQESTSEVDWEFFLCEDEILPPPRREAEFLRYRAKAMDYSYKGLIQHEERSELGDCEIELWYPYNPMDVLNPDIDCGMDGISFTGVLEEQNTICYGMIHKVRVKVLPQAPELLRHLQIVQTNSETHDQQDIYVFNVCCEDDSENFLLQPPKAANEEIQPFNNIAVLNRESSSVLSGIASFCTFTAYSPVEPWTLIDNVTAVTEKKDTCVLIDVVIYGLREHCEEVGHILDTRKVYLQEPDYRNAGLDYENPHFMDLGVAHFVGNTDLGVSNSLLLQTDVGVQLQLSDEQVMTQGLLKQNVAAAFKAATRAQSLKRIAADIRVRTPLLLHQEEALDFITQRETGPISQEYCLWKPKDSTSYMHIITGCEKNEMPIETGGGILADEMGLGKTLTILSAIIRTADDAKAFASSAQTGAHISAEHPVTLSRATLVVVPCPLLLNEWLQEIKLHCTGFSNTTIYHGYGREGNPRVLADSDVVLSTYHTIAAESTDKTSPLWQINWFRVVLDEAHIIRRMTTKLFKATKRLRANFRWCLTGTPIQNSLEDLAALVNFIRSSPLDNLHMFKKHIISPLMKGSENAVENLRQLLDSVCLRRSKQLLNLPKPISEPQLLTFSEREEKQYIETRDRLVKMINKHHQQPQSKGYPGIFQLQLQLRRLCNHGTFQKDSLGAGEFDPQQAIAYLWKQKEARCEVCGINVTGIHGIEEQRGGSFTVCGHLLCSKCVPKLKQALEKIDGRDGCLKCSLCPEIIFGEYFVIEVASPKPSKNSSKYLTTSQYFDMDGCSTKVSALAADIEQHRTEGKSIVFSCWTRSLDLIEIFLKSRNIPFVRIDGSNTLSQRKWVLENYEKDPTIPVLLMTTGTGAVGLNLTVANCVYILEPQWNPMVEIQAISRVNRLGQKRNVRVVRYIIKGTVEELELHPQQIRKLEYAKIGWKDDAD